MRIQKENALLTILVLQQYKKHLAQEPFSCSIMKKSFIKIKKATGEEFINQRVSELTYSKRYIADWKS